MSQNQATPAASYPAIDVRTVSLRDPAERPLFIACLVFSLLIWAPIVITVIPVLVLAAIGFVVSTVMTAFCVTHVRGNGLMVGPDQLPQVHAAVQSAADALEMKAPEVYVVQFGGLRETITKIFLFSRILVLSGKLLDDHGGGPELGMVIGRELVHFRFRHLWWRLVLSPSMILPFLYPAWRRAGEYSADRCGLRVCGDFDAAERAMYIAAAGGKLGRAVRAESYRNQVAESGGFWMTIAHLLSVSPSIPWRVGWLLRAMPAPQAAEAPMPRRNIAATVLCAFVPGVSARGGAVGAAGGMLATLALVAVLAGLLLPALAQARRRAREAVVLNDLHQIGIATANYADDHNGRLPPSLSALSESGYIEGELFRGPSGEETVYLVEELIEKGELSKDEVPRLWHVRHTAQTVLFYQRQGSRVIAAFCDCHVESFSEEEFQEVKEFSVQALRR